MQAYLTCILSLSLSASASVFSNKSLRFTQRRNICVSQLHFTCLLSLSHTDTFVHSSLPGHQTITFLSLFSPSFSSLSPRRSIHPCFHKNKLKNVYRIVCFLLLALLLAKQNGHWSTCIRSHSFSDFHVIHLVFHFFSFPRPLTLPRVQ